MTTAVAASRSRTAAELGLIAGAIAVVLWGIGPLFVRAMEVSAPTVIVHRFLLGTPVVVAVCYAVGGRITLDLLRRVALPGAVFGLSLLVGFTAVLNTSVANATLINNMMPVFVVLIARFVLGEHVPRRQYVAVVAAVAGIVIVVFGANGTGEAGLWGDFLAASTLGLWTWYFLRTKKLRDEGIDSWSLIAAVTVVAAVVVVPPCLLMSNDLGAVQGADWWYLAGMVIGPGVLGHGLMTWAAKHLEVTVSALLTLASPVVSAVGAWLWLGQGMTLLQAFGAGVVLAALGAIAVNARIEAVRAATLSEKPE